MSDAHDILAFWFGEGFDGYAPSDRFDLWFKKSDETDALIERRFGGLVRDALAGRLDEWAEAPESRVALVLLLDQFTRNIFRDTPRAFAGDPIATGLALRTIDEELDLELAPDHTVFCYMPLEHQEDLHLQDLCVAKMEALATRVDDAHRERFDAFVDYAHKHRDVIVEFGRYPHRNAIFGRPSTQAEVAYLDKPGAGF